MFRSEFKINKNTLEKYRGSGGDVEIPYGVNLIQDEAFKGCTALTSVIIPDSVSTIGVKAFKDCDSLKSVNFSSGLRVIAERAFFNCASLESLIIPDSVTEIRNGAFDCCFSLKNVSIGRGLTSLGREWVVGNTYDFTMYSAVFARCESLTNISVSSGNTKFKSINGNLYSYDGKKLLQYAIGKTDTTFTIPNGVTSIGECAFAWCESLKSIIIPNSVTAIEYFAFEHCHSLESIIIPSRVNSLNYGVFKDCDGLSTIYCRTKKPSLFGLPNGWDNEWLGKGREKCKAKVIWGYDGY